MVPALASLFQASVKTSSRPTEPTVMVGRVVIFLVQPASPLWPSAPGSSGKLVPSAGAYCGDDLYREPGTGLE